MAPKRQFSKQQIIDAAFEIAKTEGIEGITVRKVAEKMGGSIAPIYVNFKDCNELINAVIDKAFDIIENMSRERYTETPFLNIGIGNLRFAREYSIIYKSLTSKNKYIKSECEVNKLPRILAGMKQDSRLHGFSDEELLVILQKMQIFTHGLSEMAANDRLPEGYGQEEIIKLLEETGKDVIAAARMKKRGELE